MGRSISAIIFRSTDEIRRPPHLSGATHDRLHGRTSSAAVFVRGCNGFPVAARACAGRRRNTLGPARAQRHFAAANALDRAHCVFKCLRAKDSVTSVLTAVGNPHLVYECVSDEKSAECAYDGRAAR